MTKKKPNIMIVDDEPHIVHIIKLSFDRNKYNVVGAYSAKAALKISETEDIDLFIVDLMMPGINGYELTQAIRKTTKYHHTPIIILSGKNQMNDKLHAIDVGADDYVTKPFDPMEIERRVMLNLQIRSDEEEERKMEKIPIKEKNGELRCAVDGNALSIVRKDFVNLAESESIFIKLTKEQIDKIQNLQKPKKPDLSLGNLIVKDKGDLGIDIRRKSSNLLILSISINGVKALKEWL